jgi:hypothetical protein
MKFIFSASESITAAGMGLLYEKDQIDANAKIKEINFIMDNTTKE